MKSRTKLAMLVLMGCLSLSAAVSTPGAAATASCSSGVQHCVTASDCAAFCRRLTADPAAACHLGCCVCLG